MGERIKRIARKIGKGFLWPIKLGFVLLCLLIWWMLCIPLAESVLPAFYDQCVYHEFAEKFLREKYGEHINVHNERLPVGELANFKDYKYSFKLNGKTYQFLYAKDWGDDGDFYGDNVQSEELYQLVDSAIDVIIYESILSDFNGISWIFSEEVQPRSVTQIKMGETMFTSKYTGDNLKEFPICLDLDYAYTTAITEEELEEIFKDVRNKLLELDIVCKNISITCYDESGHRMEFDITETENGINIKRED